jgi:hypothetical protein
MFARITLLTLVLTAGALTAVGCADQPTPLALDLPETAALATATDAESRILAEIRGATARYHRVEVAVGDGYVQVSPCVASPAGGMGYHFRNMAYVDGTVDPSRPEMLLYEPQQNGELRLVGVEFVVPPGLWQGEDRPYLGEQRFGMDPFGNYALHVWVWRNNPSGMYADFNPQVSCQFAP